MPMTSKEMIKFLEKNGFTWIKSGDGSHRKFKNFETGKVTQVPYHGNKHCHVVLKGQFLNKQGYYK